MRSAVESAAMIVVVSPLFSEPTTVMIIAAIITIIFTYLTHTRKNGIRTN